MYNASYYRQIHAICCIYNVLRVCYNGGMGRATAAEAKKKQETYAKARASGKTRQASAIVAGYKAESVTLEEVTPGIKTALTAEFKKNAEIAGITREDVIQGLMDAANMGRIAADPMAMIAAYRELGKLCGFYAPEIKKVEHELGKETLHALENLSDAELIRMSRGRVIDVTPTDVEK